jgi:hypothetical protein
MWFSDRWYLKRIIGVDDLGENDRSYHLMCLKLNIVYSHARMQQII